MLLKNYYFLFKNLVKFYSLLLELKYGNQKNIYCRKRV